MAKIAERKQPLAAGGKAQGPSHENGGIAVKQKGSSKPVAEIEGQERVFSQEDTATMEQACQEIIQLSAQNKQAADQAAMKLGYMVCQMIQSQEQNQQQQEGEQAQGMEQAMNGFEQYPG